MGSAKFHTGNIFDWSTIVLYVVHCLQQNEYIPTTAEFVN